MFIVMQIMQRETMTKKSFLALVLAVFLVFMLAACGNGKNKEKSEKPDTGDTDTATVPDTETAETCDTEVVSNADPAEVEDTEVGLDSDQTEIDDSESGNVTQDGCTIKSSFGTRSVKRDIAETCIKEIAKADAAQCSWNYKNEKVTNKHITYLQRLEITFGKECKDKKGDETVECPDFIPETLKLESLSGCDVYSIDPHTNCLAPCADIYFSTGDDTFHTVYVGDESGEHPFIKSSDSIKEASLFTYMIFGLSYAWFSWSEKSADGTETAKEVVVFRRIVDPVTGEGEEEEVPDEDTLPAQCEDSEGRMYTEDDLISDGCGTLICSEEGWKVYEAYGGKSCYDGCDPESPTSMKYWSCPDGSDLEWCICEEDAEHGSKRTCIDRIDLNCPAE